MSTKCRTCDKVCSYRTEDYVPEYAALRARHNALVEAVKKYLHAHDIYGMRVAYTFGTSDEANIISAARAEVDRLIADCKGEG